MSVSQAVQSLDDNGVALIEDVLSLLETPEADADGRRVEIARAVLMLRAMSLPGAARQPSRSAMRSRALRIEAKARSLLSEIEGAEIPLRSWLDTSVNSWNVVVDVAALHADVEVLANAARDFAATPAPAGARPRSEARKFAARTAFLLVERYCKRAPSLAADRPFFRIAGLLFDAGARTRDSDLTRDCRAYAHARSKF